MPMSNSESRKRVAELAAGSDDETPKAPPGYPWPHLPSPVEPGTQPDLRPKSDSCPDFWPDGRHLDPPTEACDCDHPAPVQPPAPDPDETCMVCAEWEAQDDAAMEHIERLRSLTPVPPATTGPADETEGLAEVQRLIHMHYCGAGLDLPMPEHPYRPAEKCWAVAKVLAARDAAQQRIGAEKALREAAEEMPSHITARSNERPISSVHMARLWLTDRADRIAREGQA